MKNKFVPILIGIIVVFGAFYFYNKNKVPKDNLYSIVLYYGDVCPHCENVKKFIKDQGAERKLNMTLKEVYKNQVNREEMLQRASSICGLPANNVGVPILWTGAGCSTGDTNIIDFLKKKLDEK